MAQPTTGRLTGGRKGPVRICAGGGGATRVFTAMLHQRPLGLHNHLFASNDRRGHLDVNSRRLPADDPDSRDALGLVADNR